MNSVHAINFELTEKRTIFVGGIPADAQEEVLNRYFSRFGKVENLKVISKKQAILSDTAFCFLTFEEESASQAALDCSLHRLFSRKITCRPFLKGTTLQSKTEAEAQKKVFVKYIPKDMTESQFKNFFSGFGTVDNAYLVRYSMDSRVITIIGYVVFQDPQVALQLIKKKNIKFQKRKLKVEAYNRGEEKKGSHQRELTSTVNKGRIKQKTTNKKGPVQHKDLPYSEVSADVFSIKPTCSQYHDQRIHSTSLEVASHLPVTSGGMSSQQFTKSNLRFNILLTKNVVPLASTPSVININSKVPLHHYSILEHELNLHPFLDQPMDKSLSPVLSSRSIL